LIHVFEIKVELTQRFDAAPLSSNSLKKGLKIKRYEILAPGYRWV